MTGSDEAFVGGLPMYDWPEVAADVDRLWTTISEAAHDHGVAVPQVMKRTESLIELWGDTSMILGQVCSLNPVRDGLGETEVIGTIVYEPPDGLPDPDPGTYYSVLVARADDPRLAGLSSGGIGEGAATPSIRRFAGATVAANGTDSQSGYWSLGHFVRNHLAEGPIFGRVVFTGAHRESVRAVADGRADVAAIDVHSWRLATEHESASTDLAIIGTTDPTPGVVCVVSWELKRHRAALDAALEDALRSLRGSETASRLHLGGYRSRRLEEFQVVADQVERAARHPWHC